MKADAQDCACGPGVNPAMQGGEALMREPAHLCTAGICICSHGEENRKLRNGILDAIRVLEESKRAFKSKQLEDLRKKLTCLLAER